MRPTTLGADTVISSAKKPGPDKYIGAAANSRKDPQKTVRDALNRPAEDEKRIRAANRVPTRQIANAMAGVPKLRWRTSLDRCSKNPCSYEVAPATDGKMLPPL